MTSLCEMIKEKGLRLLGTSKTGRQMVSWPECGGPDSS